MTARTDEPRGKRRRRGKARPLAALPRPAVVAGLVFLLVEVLYYGPALAGEAVLSPAAVIYEWPPWRPFAPPLGTRG